MGERPESNEGPFLKEERDLIEVIGEQLGRVVKRLELEKGLRESEDKFRKLFETSPDLMALVDENGRFLSVNPAMADSLEYSVEELEGRTFHEVMPADTADEHLEHARRAIEEKEIQLVETEREGRHFQDYYVRFPSSDEEKTFLVVSREITARKEAEKKLEEAEREKSLILNSTSEIIAYHDTDHTLVWANRAYAESTRQSIEELEGHKCYHAWGLDTLCKGCPVTKAIETGESHEAELTPENQEQWPPDRGSWLIRASPVKDNDGTVIGAVEVALEITERRKAEKEKKFLDTLLKQDLRSKWQTIQGYLQLLEEFDLSEKCADYLRKSIRVSREVDEILDTTKKLEEIEKTDWIVERDIAKLLEPVLSDISDLAEEKGVEIEKIHPEKIGKVKGDYSLNTLFSQILKTRIQTSECDKISISTEEKNGRILITVEDNGKKLSENIKNLFSGESYTGETTGAGGVRYYMIRQIAEHNNVKIEVRDSELEGAKFDVYLQKS